MSRLTISTVLYALAGASLAGIAASALGQATQQAAPADGDLLKVIQAAPAWLNAILSGGVGGVLWGAYNKVSAFLAAYEKRSIADAERDKAVDGRLEQIERALGALPCHRRNSELDVPVCRADDPDGTDCRHKRVRGRS